MRTRAIALSSLLVAASTIAEAGPTPRRYISSQAYYHSMRAEIAQVQGDTEKVADELQLALVYDADSPLLTLRLARVQLALGRVAKARRHANRAIHLDRKNAECWRVSADVALAEGNEQVAVRALQRAVKADRTSLGAWLDLARVHRAARRDKRALEVLDKAAHYRPQEAEPLANAAEIHVEAGRIRAAARLLERALAREPRRIDLLVRLTALDERLLRPAQAVERWRAFVDAYPGEIEGLSHLARAELIVDDDEQAVRHLIRLEGLVSDPGLDRRLGFLYFSQGRYRRALGHLDRAAGLGAPDPNVRFAMGLAHYRLNEDEAALADLEQIGPGELYVRARHRIAHVLMALGRHDRAELAVRVALEARPADPQLAALLGEVLCRRGDVDGAFAVVREARKKHQVDWRLVDREARLTLRHVGAEEALVVVRAAMSMAGADKRALMFVLADVAEASGDDVLVRSTLKRLLEASPADPRALTFLGRTLAKSKSNIREAQRVVREALSQHPDAPDILDSFGWILLERKKVRRALEYLARAHRLDPRDPDIAEHYADALAASAQGDLARQIYERARAALAAQVRAREPGREADVDRLTEKLTRVGRR